MSQRCGVAAGAEMGLRLLEHLGFSRTLKYAAGARNVGDAGKKVAVVALRQWAAGGAIGFAAALASDAQVLLRLASNDEAPHAGRDDIATALARWGWMAVAPDGDALVVASGNRLTMEVTLQRLGAEGDATQMPGLILFDFRRSLLGGLSIEVVTIFQGAEAAHGSVTTFV